MPVLNQPNKPLQAGFIPGQAASVTVQDELVPGRNVWYNIVVKHEDFEWKLQKTLSDIIKLTEHENLGSATARSANTPDISKLADLDSSKEHESISKIRTDIQTYLNFILSKDDLRNQPPSLDFFEVSAFSFKKELGDKGREGYMQKRTEAWLVDRWITRWFALKDTFLLELSNKEDIEGVFLFDAVSTVEIDDGNYLKLSNSSKTISLWCEYAVDAEIWKEKISKNMEKVAAEFGGDAGNPNGSFAPVRPSIAHWFVDGCDFFSAVAEAMESAKEEIFITGWMVAPYIYLKRKVKLEDAWMLKSMIEKKAKEGIKIYVLLYDGPEAALNLGEHYARKELESLSDNIEVCCHRGFATEGDLLWSHHEKLVVIDQSIAFVSGLDLTIGRWDYHRHPLTDLPEDGNRGPHMSIPTWRGIDYTNDYVKAATHLDEPFVGHLDKHTTNRMPWHDVGSVTYHESARDVARHFIQRWNFVRAKRPRAMEEYRFLLPKVNPTAENRGKVKIHPEAVRANVQVLRSLCDWSGGLIETEGSIHEAYIGAIRKSEHFIYIENQFFVSVKDDDRIHNKIVSALIDRIREAVGTKFRVYIVVPLIPAFEGDFRVDEASQQQQIVSYLQYISMTRGENSLVGNLLKHGLSKKEIKEHVSFCALRATGELNGKAITEVLYVHSKMMVVDDKLTIIGSANINDRSMRGNRDSEVALCFTDTEMIESVMNGKKYMVGKFSSNIRKRLFAEHLGMLPEDYDDEISEFEGYEKLNDVASDDFYHDVWKKTYRENTRLYDQAFKSIPVNHVKKFSEVDAYQSEMVHDQSVKKDLLKKVTGHLVKYPTKYLEDEDLTPNAFTALSLVPLDMFT